MRTLILLALCCNVGLSLAQQPYSYPITTEQGLPSREVYRIVQDGDGFIWLGCNAGLFRYDGATFRPFRHPAQSGRAMSNLRLDARGRLWCGSFTGQVFFVENDTLRLFTDWSGHESQFPEFGFGENGTVWLTSDNGIHQVDSIGREIRHVPLPEGAPTDYLGTDNLFADGDNILIFSRKNGFLKVNGNGMEWLDAEGLSRNDMSGNCFFAEDGKGLLTVLQPRGSSSALLLRQAEGRMTVERTLGEVGRIHRVIAASDGRLWIATSTGTTPLPPEEESGEGYLFAQEKISDVLLDREGSHWFASLDRGIHIIPSLNIRYWDRLPDAHLSALGMDAAGRALLGHFSGRVSFFDRKSDSIVTLLPPDPKVFRKTETILTDNAGRTFIPRGPMSVMDTQGGISVNMVAENTKALRPFGTDSLLLATVTGLYVIHRVDPDHGARHLIREGACRRVALGAGRTFWAAFKDGVFYGELGGMTPMLHEGGRVFAADITEDGRGGVFIATINRGVLHVPSEGPMAVTDEQTGLASDITHAICRSHDTLWVAHGRGIDRIAGGSIAQFGLLDGLNVTEANALLVHHGKVLVATHGGLVAFPADLDPLNTAPPRLRLEAVAVRDSIRRQDGIMRLRHDENELRIGLTVLAFRGRGDVMVRHRLLGLDTTWAAESGNRVEVLFRTLPAGSYVFEAVAVNEDGVLSEERVTVAFTITLPWWREWWFHLLCALAIAGIVTAFFSWRIRRIRERAALEHEAVSSRLTALKAQMNPHFLFNALNSIQELILQKDVANGLKYLGKFGSLTRQILETSGQEQVTLQTEVEMLTDYLELEKLRFGDSFTYTLDISAEIDPEGILIPPMLIQPYVENALKHGLLHRQTDRRLSIVFKQEGEMLHVTVTDNGIGRKASGEIAKRQSGHRPFSTSATAKRLELLRNENGEKGSVEIVDLMDGDEAMGTEVRMRIPVY